jgi:hypothetical protein
MRGDSPSASCWLPPRTDSGRRSAGFRNDAKRILGVPGKRVVRSAISIGYPAHPPRRGRRKPLSDLVHEERYSA